MVKKVVTVVLSLPLAHECLTELVLGLLMSVKLTFHELSYVKKSGPTFFVVIFFVICLTVNNLSGILNTRDTNFMQPWAQPLTYLSQGRSGWLLIFQTSSSQEIKHLFNFCQAKL